VLLAGRGAEAFADSQGLARVADPTSYYRAAVDLTRREGSSSNDTASLTHGTVGAVALDCQGRLAAATSTGGMLNKQAGRVGDTALIGAATWADSEVAVSCTGQGEFFIRTAAAHDVAARVSYQGIDVEAAAQAVLDAVGALGGNGGLIAIDRDGRVTMPFNSSGMKRGFVRLHGEAQIDIY
jgi:beta-aspartyl-peptidase (threonine type)